MHMLVSNAFLYVTETTDVSGTCAARQAFYSPVSCNPRVPIWQVVIVLKLFRVSFDGALPSRSYRLGRIAATITVVGAITGGAIGALTALHVGSHRLNQWVNAQESDFPLADAPVARADVTDGLAARDDPANPASLDAIPLTAATVTIIPDEAAATPPPAALGLRGSIPLPTARPAHIR
jgi:hypothetical protein